MASSRDHLLPRRSPIGMIRAAEFFVAVFLFFSVLALFVGSVFAYDICICEAEERGGERGSGGGELRAKKCAQGLLGIANCDD